MHKASGVRDPAAAFPLPSVRDDAADRRAASRAVAVSAIGLAVTGLVELLRAVLTGQVTWPLPTSLATAPNSTSWRAGQRLQDNE